MSKAPEYYRQCQLRRVDGHVDTCWLPEQYAQCNKYLKLKRGGKWENGWQVVAVHARAEADQVLAKERDYLTQREASDV